MLRSVSRVILEGAMEATPPAKMFPCTVTQVTPLLITILGETAVPGQKIAGLTYSLGAAVAFMTSPGTPLVIPTLTLGA